MNHKSNCISVTERINYFIWLGYKFISNLQTSNLTRVFVVLNKKTNHVKKIIYVAHIITNSYYQYGLILKDKKSFCNIWHI